MKALFLLCLMVISMMTIAQNQNTFPSSGNVGINTSNAPSERLHVNGNARVDSCLVVRDSAIVEKDLRTKGKFTVEDKAFFFQKVTMYDKLNVVGNINGDNNINAVNNVTADHNVKAANNVVAENNVNVGNKLNVTGVTTLNDKVKMPGLDLISDPNSPDIEFLVKMPNGVVYRADGDMVRSLVYSKECIGGIQDIASPVWNNGLNKIFVNYPCAGVKVGIRTSDPEYFLDVREMAYLERLKVGAVPANEDGMINGFDITNSRDLIQLGVYNAFTNYQSDVRFRINHDGALYSKNYGSLPSLSIYNGTGNAVVIYDNSGDKIFQIQDDGLLRSREIRVDNNQNQWPDFVFEDDYVLRPLNDVELYIKKYKRLPDIPSAAEIDAKGINVAEMHSLQMQKIEELTLYMIQMQKQIDSLQTRVIELEKNH